MKRLLAFALIAPLVACASSGPVAPDAPESVLPTSRFEPRAEETDATVSLAVRDDGLSPAQRQALAEIALEKPDGAIVLRAPADARSRAHAAATERFLNDLGLRDVRVEAGAEPVVQVSWRTVKAVIPDCDRSWGDLTKTKSNRSHANFGCAVNANMAAQIADPRDLIVRRAETTPDAARRATVIDKYRKGGATAAEATERDSAAIAKSVQ